MKITPVTLTFVTLASATQISADVLSLAQEEARTSGEAPTTTTEEASPWYFHAAGGGNMMFDSDFENEPYTMKFDPGVAVDLGVGYSLNKIFAVQFQTGIAWNRIDSIEGPFVSGGEGDAYQVPLTVNLVRTVALHPDFSSHLTSIQNFQATSQRPHVLSDFDSSVS